ncbi:MAG: hypothetical protein ABJ382_13635, partial [Ilumatobacter sp.]
MSALLQVGRQPVCSMSTNRAIVEERRVWHLIENLARADLHSRRRPHRDIAQIAVAATRRV